jgi:hypothetical protein
MGGFTAVEAGMNLWLLLAAICNFAIAALHVYIIQTGETAYRFFGAGEEMAQAAAQGSVIPTLVTSLIVVVFVLWGLYTLAGARIVKPLFLTQTAIYVISGVFLLRGGLPFLAAPFVALDQFVVISSLISLAIGLIHWFGQRQANLPPDSLKIHNVHQRRLEPNPKNGQLLNQLASSQDILWAHERWMPMHFDRPLQVGARGGHGSIGYDIVEYIPEKRIRFRFTAPKGFEGWHELSLENNIMRHEIKMVAHAKAIAIWFFIRPIHDTIVEESLDKAQSWASGQTLKPRAWTLWVRVLRWVMAQRAKRSVRVLG